eukprot:gene10337-7232_t
MTFNKPRGRDLLSQAFESRIRILPLSDMGELYQPVHTLRSAAATAASSGKAAATASSNPSHDGASSPQGNSDAALSTKVLLEVPKPNPLDPTSSVGNPLRTRRMEEGDDRVTAVIRERQRQEQAVAHKTSWHVAVVDPLPSRGFRLRRRAVTTNAIHKNIDKSSSANAGNNPSYATTTTTTTCPHVFGWYGSGRHRQRIPLTHVAVVATAALPARPIQLTESAATAPTERGEPNSRRGEEEEEEVEVEVEVIAKLTPPPVFFPQPHPLYYTTTAEGGIWPASHDPKAKAKRVSSKVVVMEPLVLDPAPTPSPSAEASEGDHTILHLLPHSQRRHLQKACDCTLLPARVTKSVEVHMPPTSAAASAVASSSSAAASPHQGEQEEVVAGNAPCSPQQVDQHYYLIPCLDPWIEKREYGREEAQVEMITAYRNILMECAELYRIFPTSSSSSSSAGRRSGSDVPRPAARGLREGKGFNRWSLAGATAPDVVDVLRVPALCLDQWRRAGGAEEEDDESDAMGTERPTEDGDEVPMWLHEIGKLNQQALLKGFHRLPQEAKEALLQNPAFTVEVYVPPQWLPHFTQAFLEEAWEVPSSVVQPGRTALYPGLAPPPTLLAMEGWTGKRRELTDAIETKGKSLLRGPHYQLDGRQVQEEEVWTQIKVFGGRAEQEERIKLERATAAEAEATPQGEASKVVHQQTTATHRSESSR